MIRDKISVICSEDPSLIENYDKAVKDKDNLWILHHRYEVTINGEPLLTSDELKSKNLYFHRPASELIFLTPEEHSKIHSIKEKNNLIQLDMNPDKVKYREYQKDYSKKRYAKNKQNWKDYLMKKKYSSLSLEKLKRMLSQKENSVMEENKKQRLIAFIKEAIDLKLKENI